MIILNLPAESLAMEVLSFAAVIFDYFVWVAQYFGDWLRFYLGLYIWTLFNALQDLIDMKDEGRAVNLIKVRNLVVV